MKNFAYSLGVLSFLALGGVVAYMGVSSQEGTLSKFTQPSQVTTQTLSTLWTPSTDNPHRTKLQAYGHAARTDAIIVLMLKKGLTLDKAGFTTYVQNLQGGITAMANEPMFRSDVEIQEIAQYIAYEITDTTNVLNGRDIFFERLTDLVNEVQSSSGAKATGSGTTEDLLNELASLIQGTSPTIVTTTTTSTGTTTTTSGSGTGNITEDLLNDLAVLINGSNTQAQTTSPSSTSTGTADDLMNDLGTLINGTSSETSTQTNTGTTGSASSAESLIDDLLRLIG